MNPELLATTIAAYLSATPDRVALLATPSPLVRTQTVRTATWEPWLRDGGPNPSRPGYVGALPPVHAGVATGVLDALERVPAAGRRPDARIDRAALVAYAQAARASGEPRDRLALWVAVMLWGGGSSNGRAPWCTAKGLADPGLEAALGRSFDLVAAGDLPGAYRAMSAISGLGAPFFTKWLWVASLGQTPELRPLILDSRVLITLRALHRTAGPWKEPVGAVGYDAFVRAADQAARQVGGAFPGVDAEKVEWLLFERDDGCLRRWLVPSAQA